MRQMRVTSEEGMNQHRKGSTHRFRALLIFICTFCFLAVLPLSGAAVQFCPTGVVCGNNNVGTPGSFLAGNAQDKNWTISFTNQPAPPNSSSYVAVGCGVDSADCGPAPANWPLNGTWASSATAQWISPFSGDTSALPAAGYEYDYTQVINLTSFVSGAELKGNFASDNCILGIFINATQVVANNCASTSGNDYSNAAKAAFDITTGFVYGALNTITFKVQNLATPMPNPSGLLVEVTSATGNNTPEPATLFGVGLGLAVVGLAYRRRRS
jgi:hypothetical protein